MIAGVVRIDGNEHFLWIKEISNQIKYYLVSKVCKQDLVEYQLNGRASGVVIQDLEALPVYYSEDYLLEAITKSKATGTVKKYGEVELLERILDAIYFAKSYRFPEECIEEDSQKKELGSVKKIFSARNDTTVYERIDVDDVCTMLHVECRGVWLYLSETMIRLPNVSKEKYHDVTVKQRKQIMSATIKTVTYDTLAGMLDMSWYRDQNGRTLKDYKSVKTILEFETIVMTPLCLAIKREHDAGRVLDIGIDTETTGLNVYNLSKDNVTKDHVVSLQLSWEDDQGVVIFFDMEHFQNVDQEYVLSRLAVLFENFTGKRSVEYYVSETSNVDQKGNTVQDLHCVHEMVSFGGHEEDFSTDGNLKKRILEFERSWIDTDGHNCGFDRRAIYDSGKEFWFDDDTLQMAFNLNPKTVRGNNKLKLLTRRIFGHETPELSDVLGRGNEDKYRYLVDEEVARIYGCADTDYARQLKRYLQKIMPQGMYERYKSQDTALINILPVSEYFGLATYEDELRELGEATFSDIQKLKQAVYSYVGVYMDYAQKLHAVEVAKSMGQYVTEEQYQLAVAGITVDTNATYEFEFKAAELRYVLYDLLKYPVFAYTDGAKHLPKTDKYVIKKLLNVKRKPNSRARKINHDILVTGADRAEYERLKGGSDKDKKQAAKMCLISADDFNSKEYPVALIIQKYSELNKEYTSYYKPMLEQNMEGKIFKSYAMARIETRRISNPIQTTKGSLKALIKAYSDDYYTLDFDMSQVEYRIMLSLSHFTKMITKMKDPEKDFHKETAAMVYKKPAYKVTKKERKGAKQVSFGIPYGLGDYSLCEQMEGEVNDDALFATRMLLHSWKQENKPIVDLLEEARAEALTPCVLSEEQRFFMNAYKRDPETKEFLLDKDGNRIPIDIGKVHNQFGFYRTFDLSDIGQTPADKKRRESGEFTAAEGVIRRAAGNYVIQSFAAELFRIILIRFYKLCEQEGIHLGRECIWHMLIHDELLCSIHKSIHPAKIYEIVKKACMITLPGHTNYFVGINMGRNWAECKDDDHEAPVLFVNEMVERWRAGEFTPEKTPAEFLKNGDPAQGYWFDDPYAFIEPLIDDYKLRRVHTVIKTLQPDVDTNTIDVKGIFEKFDNYTVRDYVRSYPKYGSIDKTTAIVGKDTDGNLLYDDNLLSNLEDQESLITWIARFYKEPRTVQKIDGMTITVDGLAEIRDISKEESKQDLDYDNLFADDCEEFEDDDYYSFDEDDIVYTVQSETEEYEQKDDDRDFIIDYSKAKEATSIAGMLVTEEKYKSIRVLNNTISIKTDRAGVGVLKQELRKYVHTGAGQRIIFIVSGIPRQWLSVNPAFELSVIDEVVTGCITAMTTENTHLKLKSLELRKNNVLIKIHNMAHRRQVILGLQNFGVTRKCTNPMMTYSVYLIDAFGSRELQGYVSRTADLEKLNKMIS